MTIEGGERTSENGRPIESTPIAKAGCGCLAIPFVLMLLGILGFGIFFLVDSITRTASNERVDGTIVELIEQSDSDGSSTFTPVVEYTVGGRTYRVESKVSSGGLAIPDIGDTREVLYDPNDPGDAVVGGIGSLWVLPLLMILIPLALIVGAVVVWRRATVGRHLRKAADEISADPDIRAPIRDARRIDATFMGAQPSPMDAAGRMRYRVRAKAPVDGVEREFFSNWLDEDPTLDLIRTGNRVTVVIDANDPEMYRIELPSGS